MRKRNAQEELELCMELLADKPEITIHDYAGMSGLTVANASQVLGAFAGLGLLAKQSRGYYSKP